MTITDAAEQVVGRKRRERVSHHEPNITTVRRNLTAAAEQPINACSGLAINLLPCL